MLNLTVTGRIIASNAILFLIAIIILATGLYGMSNMNQSFNQLVDKAMPMTDASSQIVSSLLQTNILLVRYQDTRSKKARDNIETLIDSLKSKNERATKAITALSSDSPELTAVIKEISANKDKIFSDGENLISSHKDRINKVSELEELSMEFTDFGDEILSYAYDLSGVTNSSSTLENVDTLAELLDSTSTLATDTTSATIKMEALEARSELQGSLSEIRALIATFSSDSQLKESAQLATLVQSFDGYEESAVQLVNLQLSKLEKDANVKTLLLSIDETIVSTISGLDKLSNILSTINNQIKESTEDTVSGSRIALIGFAVVAFGAGSVISVLVIRSISQPLNQTVNTIQELAKGDFSVNFPQTSEDELGKLMGSMQNLVQQLRSILNEINANSEQLAATAEQSASISQHTTENVNDQKEQTNVVVQSIEEMTLAVNEVSRSANETLAKVESAHADVSKGETVLNQNITRIRHLAAEIEQGSEVIQRLNNDCTNIGTVLDVIRGVAEQTNLLALNAAIEAARAGEQGRGFAVVADEVRTLASRSHDSTAEIQEIIQRLQSASKDAVDIMSKSKLEAQTSVESILAAGDTLSHIAKEIEEIRGVSNQIAAATEQQAVSAQTQKDNINAIGEISEETFNGAKESEAASQELAKMAENQRELVNRFKL